MKLMQGMQKSFLVLGVMLSFSGLCFAENGAYTLNEVAEKGNNTITKYEYNKDTNQLTPKYYDVKLNRTEYGYDGTTNVGTKKHYSWNKDSSGNYKLEVSSSSNYDVRYVSDSTRQSSSRVSIGSSGANVDKDFVARSNSSNGGALYNYSGKAGNVTGDFVGNRVTNSSGSVFGGAIFNYSNAKMGNVVGNFIANYATGSYAFGGAIYNRGSVINEISGDFVGNYVVTTNNNANGGAIYNYQATIGDVTANFIGNSATASSGNGGTNGGAIANSYNSTIGNISGDFIGNYATGYNNAGEGGAIYNYNNSSIGSISGDFIGNYAYSRNGSAFGGAINNDDATIGDIIGDFTENHAHANGTRMGAYGGAIASRGTINSLAGDFTGNYAKAIGERAAAIGGAIHNNYGATINSDITSNFTKNYVHAEGAYADAYGGAIYSYGTLKNINSSFIDNYVYAKGDHADAYGGAICNYYHSSLKNINSSFINNYVYANGDNANAYGGAIYNDSSIADILGDFVRNYVIADGSNASAHGGAIYNSSSINSITGNFIGNYATSTGSDAYGGAIYNGGNINSISANFYNNQAIGSSGYGGAIYNAKDYPISISGNFINNKITAKYWGYGAGIYQSYGTISEVIAEFTENTISSGSEASGAGIYHRGGTISNITSNFTKNSVQANYNANGAAIYNNATIANINGNFVENTANASQANGGAIYNSSYGLTGSIKGDFTGNNTVAENFSTGGAIHNAGLIGVENPEKVINFSVTEYHFTNTETGETITSYTKLSDDTKQKLADGYKLNVSFSKTGGDISPEGWESIKNNFLNNSYYSTTNPLDELTEDDYVKFTDGIKNANFKNNYAKSNSDLALGGAIYTEKDLNIIADNANSTFQGNYTEDNIRGKVDNAIFVKTSSGAKTTLTLKAINNGSITFHDKIEGGSVDNKTINSSDKFNLNITGDNTGRVALYNDVVNADVKADNVTIDFANNKIKEYNFNSLNAGENTKLNIDVDLTNKVADSIRVNDSSSGIITINMINYIGANDDKVKVQVIKNSNGNLQLKLGDNFHIVTDVIEAMGDTVYNDEIFAQEDGIALGTTETKNDSISFLKDKIYDGLAEYSRKDSSNDRNYVFRTSDTYVASENLGETAAGTFNVIGQETGSKINANGHSLFNLTKNTILNIKNVLISGAEAKQGSVVNAQNSDSSVNLTNVVLADNKGGAIYSKANVNISAIRGKSILAGANDGSNVVYLDNSDKTLTLNAQNEGIIAINDKISGKQGFGVDIKTDSNSKVYLNDEIKKANVKLDGNLYLAKENYLNNANSVTFNSGFVSMQNGAVGNMHVAEFNLTGPVSMAVDADLANQTMDRITADKYNVSNGGMLNVSNIRLLSDAVQNVTRIDFADKELAHNVSYTGAQGISYGGSNPIAYSPIYKYDVSYLPESGQFLFARGSSSNSSSNFNPSVLATPVTSQSSGFATQSQTFNYAFQHADNFMNIPYLERIALRESGRYAMSPSGDATDVGTFSPLTTRIENAGYWFKPYVSFENIPLKNGPKVDNINYGSLIGFDSNLKQIGHGFDRVLTGYIGYNGASQSYSGVNAYQNGGVLGGTITLYKGNFFNATTISAGSSVGETYTMYGHDNYTMLLAGIGDKFGYNFEFKKGKYIVQPSMLLSYTFVNTFDYTNAAGVKISSDPLHAMQIQPGVKFIMNTKNGWQPYASVSMVWNALNRQKVMANDVRLPQMTVKPYVQYGLGIQRMFKDRFMAFGQAMITNGGRNGIALTFGLRWFVGK